MGLEERNGRLYYYRKETGDFGDFDGVWIDVDALVRGHVAESLESLVPRMRSLARWGRNDRGDGVTWTR